MSGGADGARARVNADQTDHGGLGDSGLMELQILMSMREKTQQPFHMSCFYHPPFLSGGAPPGVKVLITNILIIREQLSGACTIHRCSN